MNFRVAATLDSATNRRVEKAQLWIVYVRI